MRRQGRKTYFEKIYNKENVYCLKKFYFRSINNPSFTRIAFTVELCDNNKKFSRCYLIYFWKKSEDNKKSLAKPHGYSKRNVNKFFTSSEKLKDKIKATISKKGSTKMHYTKAVNESSSSQSYSNLPRKSKQFNNFKYNLDKKTRAKEDEKDSLLLLIRNVKEDKFL
jgi:hypothetical protein